MTLTQVNSAGIADGAIVNADVNASADLALSKLDTSGTASSSNFLRGDGAWTAIDLTALSASNLTSGTVPDARFPATLPAVNGSALTNLNASNIASGTIASARVPTLNQNTTGSAATLTTARTIAGVSFDGSANISLNNNAITNGAGYITATLTQEQVEDYVGGMVTGNTETGITVTYQDSDGTLDFVVGTLNQDTTGNAATATALETARTIGGTSFDGTANITPANATNSVNVTGTVGSSATGTTQSAGDNSTKIATTAYVKTAIDNLIDGAPSALDTLNELAAAIDDDASYASTITTALGTKLPLAGGTMTGAINLNSNNITNGGTITGTFSGNITGNVTGNASGSSGSCTGNAATATTLATARTIAGVSFDGSANISLNNNAITNGAGYITATLTEEQVEDYVGGMVTGNTETGITVTYQDSDGTLDFAVASQTDNNFTTTLKNKLDGIAAGATNVSNTNQLTNGAGFITSSGTSAACSGNAATATLATNVTVTANNGNNETVYLAFVDSAGGGTQGIETDSGLYYNPSENSLATTEFVGGLIGNVTGNASGSSGSCTGNAATATALATARTIAGVSFDGSANISLNNNAITNGASYITASNAAITNKLPLAGGTLTGSVKYNDDVKALFGTGSDLEIHHDGNNSFIDETGTGILYIRSSSTIRLSDISGNNMILCEDGGETQLFHNGSEKLNTSSGGVTVTGTCTATAFSGPLTGNVTGNTSGSAGSCTGNAATATTLATARTIAGTSFNGSANISISYDNLTNKPTVPTNNNQLTNGAGYVTSSSAGKCLQVQSYTRTSSYTTVLSNNSYGGDMGLNVNITPASSSNKILIWVHCNLGMNSDKRVGFVVYRNGSVIDGWRGTSSEGSSRARVAASGRTPSNHNMVSVTSQYVDSPSSTSQVTYSVRPVTPQGYRFYLNRMEGSGGNPGNSWDWPIASSTITVMEIAG